MQYSCFVLDFIVQHVEDIPIDYALNRSKENRANYTEPTSVWLHVILAYFMVSNLYTKCVWADVMLFRLLFFFVVVRAIQIEIWEEL